MTVLKEIRGFEARGVLPSRRLMGMCRTLDGVAFEAQGVLPSRRLMGMCRTLDGVAFEARGYFLVEG